MPPTPCAICGRIPATYVCQNCGKPTCGDCFDSASWTCNACSSRAVTDPWLGRLPSAAISVFFGKHIVSHSLRSHLRWDVASYFGFDHEFRH